MCAIGAHSDNKTVGTIKCIIMTKQILDARNALFNLANYVRVITGTDLIDDDKVVGGFVKLSGNEIKVRLSMAISELATILNKDVY